MSCEEGGSLALRRHTLQQQPMKMRIRSSRLMAILGCLCGILLLQQFNCLRKLVSEDVGGNRILLAPLEDSKSLLLTNERESVKPLTANPLTRSSTKIVSGGDSRKENAVLVFRFPNRSGQGTGNIMSGALAAQLLAEEFNRTFCHTGADSMSVYASFRKAFDWVDNSNEEFCNRIVAEDEEKMAVSPLKVSKTIVQRNYDQTSEQSECGIKEVLSNHTEYPIVYYEGNTYPRWPNKGVSLPRDYFHERFKPTKALREVLPWKEPVAPPIVVHLRYGDDERDIRGGLDGLTLSLLAKNDFLEDSDSELPIFLVTNNVELYSRFPKWSHPDWSLVHHSALRRISWGKPSDLKHNHSPKSKSDGELEMWSDWYTLLNADKIYHTFSDFSRSASRWNENIKSWTILGSTENPSDGGHGNSKGSILLRNDIQTLTNGSQEGVSRLVDRETNELWFCGNPSPAEQKHVQEKKDRQLLDLLRSRKQIEASEH